MKLLIFLIVSFALALAVIWFVEGSWDYRLAGRIAMSVMLVITAIGHFVYARGMQMMLPAYVPFKKELVFLTGIIEILAAIGLLLPAFYRLTGWLLIVFFILIIPANISAALRKVDFQKATMDGPGAGYLWLRVPMQVIFIVWVYLSALAGPVTP